MSAWLWPISRATGSVSLVLLTLGLVLGTTLSSRRRPHAQAPTLTVALHRWLSLGLVTFLAAHVVTAIVDGYVDISWLATLVPFTSAYETWWVGLGTLAVDLLLAVVATSLLRHRIPERRWQGVHLLAYALWPIALLHGWGMGSADALWLREITLACGVVGLLAVAARLLTPDTPLEVARTRRLRLDGGRP